MSMLNANAECLISACLVRMMDFDNRKVTFETDHTHAQNRGIILMGMAVWRVTRKTKIVMFVFQESSEHCSERSARSERSERP